MEPSITEHADIVDGIFRIVCDAVERASRHWSVTPDDEDLLPATDYSRAAALRIMVATGAWNQPTDDQDTGGNYREAFAAVLGIACDVIERAWQRWPVERGPDEAPVLHSSDYARTAAARILAAIGWDWPDIRAERAELDQVAVTRPDLLSALTGQPIVVKVLDGPEVVLRLLTADEYLERQHAAAERYGMDKCPPDMAEELTRPSPLSVISAVNRAQLGLD